MKKRYFTLMLVALVGVMFVSLGALTAADCTDVPDEVIIENDHGSDKKGPVKLSHKKHTEEYGVGCTDCHHVYKDGKNVWKEGDPIEKCSACHDAQKSDGNAKKLQLAFHSNCKDCHKEAFEKDGKEAPFKKCNDCHQ